MQKWDYTMRLAYIGRSLKEKGDPSRIWSEPMNPKEGKATTHWDEIKQWGEEGWELVNAFPIAGWRDTASGATDWVAFIFKRPKE